MDKVSNIELKALKMLRKKEKNLQKNVQISKQLQPKKKRTKLQLLKLKVQLLLRKMQGKQDL